MNSDHRAYLLKKYSIVLYTLKIVCFILSSNLPLIACWLQNNKMQYGLIINTNNLSTSN